jgi:very-short-patch-repair endonuclease
VVERERLLGTVDFAWPAARVLVEAEGFAFHSGRKAWDRDIERYNRLTLSGWRVLRLTSRDILDGTRGVFLTALRALLPAPRPE